MGKKIEREKKTVEIMIGIFCRGHHHTHAGSLCSECSELLAYAHARLERCPHGDRKPTCRMCPVHCYRKDMRVKIAEIMRYSGPRMLFHHPIAAFRHLFSEMDSKNRRKSIVGKKHGN